MTEKLRVGTRRSRLARAQTEWVVSRLSRRAGEVAFEPVPLDTSGDRDQSVGSAADFTDAIDRALLRGEVDLAVHSAKDLPVELDHRFALVACPRRADPRDCLVVQPQFRAGRLPRGARVGSSSLRRRAQILRWRADLDVVELRGNVDTRLGLVHSGAIDAAVLASAGVSRLGQTKEVDRLLPTARFLPAPAQGALAVVARSGDSRVAMVARPLDHQATRSAVLAERAFAARLGGDCRLALGALATCRGKSVSLVGEVLSPDGRRSLRVRRSGPASRAEELGRSAGAVLLERDAPGLLSLARP